MSQPDTRRLICTSCQHENEVERVYCHNCGEKLDRSLLPKVDLTKPSEEKTKAAKKVKKLMDSNRLNWWMTLKTFLLVEFLAVLVAAGYLIVQTPAFVVPLNRDKLPELEVGDLWSELLKQNVAANITFKENDVNYYLSKVVKGGAGSMGKFERAMAHLEKDLITLAVQRSVLGLTICHTTAFTPAHDGLKWKADIKRVAIGRLTVPTGIAKMLNLDATTLGAFSQVFEKDIQRLDRLEKIEVADGNITFVTRQQK